MYPLSFSEFMTIYDGNRYDGWNEYITYSGIPLVVLAETEEQKMTLLDNLFKETYICDNVKKEQNQKYRGDGSFIGCVVICNRSFNESQ